MPVNGRLAGDGESWNQGKPSNHSSVLECIVFLGSMWDFVGCGGGGGGGDDRVLVVVDFV